MTYRIKIINPCNQSERLLDHVFDTEEEAMVVAEFMASGGRNTYVVLNQSTGCDCAEIAGQNYKGSSGHD